MGCDPEDIIKRGNTWAREWRPKDAQGADFALDAAGVSFKLDIVDTRGAVLASFNSSNGGTELAVFSLHDSDGAEAAAGPWVRATLTPTQTTALTAEPAVVQLTVTLSATEVYSSQEEEIEIVSLAA